MMNVPPPTYDSTVMTSTMTTTLTPYLTLPHLLSLTWLAYPILSLAFIAFRLMSSLSDAQSSLENAKSTLLASCKAAETAATSAASMPRFLAIKTNEQYVDAVNGSLDAARKALVLALTIMEAIINFIIDLYRSTLLCFLELVVRAGLSILIGAVNEINQLLQTISSGLRTSIQTDIQGANSVIQTAIDGINKINPFSDIKAPQIPVPNLDALNNVTLPSTISDALNSLNSSLPSVAELKNEVESIIDTPFELVKKEINDTFAGIVLTPEGLPVPERSLISFCGDMDMSVVDELGQDLIKAAKIGLVILFVIVLILIGFNCLLEWYQWRCLKRHFEYTRQAWATDPILIRYPSGSSTASQQGRAQPPPTMTMTDHNLLILQNTSAHPLIARILNQISAKLHLTPSTYTTLTWFFSYIFHPSALACLLVGLLGLLSIQLQLIALRPLVSSYQSKGQQQVTDFSNTIATAINASMYNQSSIYTSSINTRVANINTQLSSGILGSIQNTTIHINTTIANFYADVQNGVEKVFGGTILDSPMQEFVKCFLGSKVDAVENVLTFLEREVAIQLPTVNESVLVLQPDQVQELSRPIALAAVGGDSGDGSSSDQESGLLQKIVLAYVRSLEKERITFFIFLGCWFVVVLMGIIIILWNRRKSRRRVRVSGYNYDTGTGFGNPAGVSRSGSLGAGAGGKWFAPLRALAERSRSWKGGEGRARGGKEDRKTMISPFRMSVGEDGDVLPWSTKNEKKGLHERVDSSTPLAPTQIVLKNEGRKNSQEERELPQFTPMPSPVPGLDMPSRNNSLRTVDEEFNDNTAEKKEMRKTIGAGWARRFAERFVGGGSKAAAAPQGEIALRKSEDSGIGFPAPLPPIPSTPIYAARTSTQQPATGKKTKRNTLSKPPPHIQEELLEDVPSTPILEEGRRGLAFLGRKPSFLRNGPAQEAPRPKLIQPLIPKRLNVPPPPPQNPIAPVQPVLPPSPVQPPTMTPTPAPLRNPPPMLRITVNPPSGDFSKSVITGPMPMKPKSHLRNVSGSNPFSPPMDKDSFVVGQALGSPPPPPPGVKVPGVSPFSPERTGFGSATSTASPTQNRFAPPLHHGFNDSRYPRLPGGKENNGATTISAAAFRGGHQKRQSTLMVPTTPGGAGNDHRRSWSMPMSATTATPTTAGSTMTTSELQRSMLRGLDDDGIREEPRSRPASTSQGQRFGLSLDHTTTPPMNPFDDERRVKIEKPARTRKSVIPSRTSLKINPFEVEVEEHW